MNVDESIDRLEQLYTALTGEKPIDGNGTLIPPEVDPGLHLDEQLRRVIEATSWLVPDRPPLSVWRPRAVVSRGPRAIEIAVDLPGVGRDEIEIFVDNGRITIQGRRHAAAPNPRAAQNVEACEIPFGAFCRSFHIASHVEPEEVIAQLVDGVLTIRVASSLRGQPSQIPIRS